MFIYNTNLEKVQVDEKTDKKMNDNMGMVETYVGATNNSNTDSGSKKKLWLWIILAVVIAALIILGIMWYRKSNMELSAPAAFMGMNGAKQRFGFRFY